MSEDSEAGNSCGACTVCCKVLRIDETSKPAGVMCQHCTGSGCGIYETRPPVCQGFMCGWRLLPKLGDDWRPDLSGVLIRVMDPEDLEEEYRARGNGMNFVIVGGEKAVLRPGFANYVSTLVARNVAVYMSADSPKTLINKYLRPLVAAKDQTAVTQMLLHIYRQHVTLREFHKQSPLPWIEMP